MSKCWVCGEEFADSEMHLETDYEGVPRLVCPFDVLEDPRYFLRETTEFFLDYDIETGRNPFGLLRNTVWRAKHTNQKGRD